MPNSNMQIRIYRVGPVETNCYFISNAETKELVIIDPGGSAEALADKIQHELDLDPVAILLTHGHFDHADGADELSKLLDAPIYAYEKERIVLDDAKYNLSHVLGKSKVYHADIFLKDNEVVTLAGFDFKVLATPGHTPGGCSYYIAEEHVVFTGDTLFYHDIGRSDFPYGSSTPALIQGIQERLMTLPDDTKVFPGHEIGSSIGEERYENPYIDGSFLSETKRPI
jgi:glyoxylase-like metal-dependent hydrolase (beta-lactamase superfamily II)